MNIITPEVIGYYRLRDGRYAELSEGYGLERRPLFGVTIEPRRGPGDTASQCFASRAQALQYIDALS
jgi:hypothetical protein